jgi:hypothetical protein
VSALARLLNFVCLLYRVEGNGSAYRGVGVCKVISISFAHCGGSLARYSFHYSNTPIRQHVSLVVRVIMNPKRFWRVAAPADYRPKADVPQQGHMNRLLTHQKPKNDRMDAEQYRIFRNQAQNGRRHRMHVAAERRHRNANGHDR